MQTFLPYSDFQKSALVLDWRRLGKQRIEAATIYKILTQPDRKRWRNHPAVRMWKGYEDVLALYHDEMVSEWIKRGYRNSMPYLAYSGYVAALPSWIGDPDFHRSHQSNLIRKDSGYYQKLWPDVPNNLPYIWPVTK